MCLRLPVLSRIPHLLPVRYSTSYSYRTHLPVFVSIAERWIVRRHKITIVAPFENRGGRKKSKLSQQPIRPSILGQRHQKTFPSFVFIFIYLMPHYQVSFTSRVVIIIIVFHKAATLSRSGSKQQLVLQCDVSIVERTPSHSRCNKSSTCS